MKKRAFTLTELLVVVVIIGVLSAVVLPKFTKVLQTRKTTEAENVMAAVRNEQEARCMVGRNYTADTNKIASLPKAKSQNYTYVLGATGITAEAKDGEYELKIPSYTDGRICCSGEGCDKLNRDYPKCDDTFLANIDEATCEAQTPDPVSECDKNSKPQPESKTCEPCGETITKIVTCDTSTFTWKEEWPECKTEAQCSSDRRLCGGGTEKNPDEAEIDWNGTTWSGVECRRGRQWPPPDKYDIPIPDDATEAEIQALCCGGEGECAEGEWLTEEDTCCPIGQVSDGKGGCTSCDPAKNEIVDSSSRTCVPKFVPTYHDGFGIMDDSGKVYGPYFTITGPQCGRSVVGKQTGSQPCREGWVTRHPGSELVTGDLCNYCNANDDTCEISCYFEDSYQEARKEFDALPAIAYSGDTSVANGYTASETVGGCSASVFPTGGSYNTKGNKYRLDGWTDISAGAGVSVSWIYGKDNAKIRPITTFCNGEDRPSSCNEGIDPMAGWKEWMRDLAALALEEQRLAAESEEENQNQYKNSVKEYAQQQGQQNNNNNNNNRPQGKVEVSESWAMYVGNHGLGGAQAGTVLTWSQDGNTYSSYYSESQGKMITRDQNGNQVDVEPREDATPIYPNASAYTPTWAQEYVDMAKNNGKGYVVVEYDNGWFVVDRTGALSYFDNSTSASNSTWTGTLIRNPDGSFTEYYSDGTNIGSDTFFYPGLRTLPPSQVKIIDLAGESVGRLVVGPKGTQAQPLPFSTAPANVDLSQLNININTSTSGSQTTPSNPGPGSGSYWMYNMWNDGITYTSGIGDSGPGTLTPESFAGPYCYDCVADSKTINLSGDYGYLNEDGSAYKIGSCTAGGAFGLTGCMSPVHRKVIGVVCTPWGAR